MEKLKEAIYVIAILVIATILVFNILKPSEVIVETIYQVDTIYVQVELPGDTVVVSDTVFIEYEKIIIDTLKLEGKSYSTETELYSQDKKASVKFNTTFNLDKERFYFTNILFTVEEKTIKEKETTTIIKQPRFALQAGSTVEEDPSAYVMGTYIHKDIFLSIGYNNRGNWLFSAGYLFW